MFLRNIKDIRISNNTISVIRDANISLDELENQIRSIDYKVFKDSKSNITENAKLPPFIQVFYYLFFSNLKVPSLNDFIETYLKWAGVENEGRILIDNVSYPIEGIKARLNRTYPSLVRDLHFLYLIENSKMFEQVDYSMERDYYNGLDLKLIYNNEVYYISLFIDTSRAQYFKRKKIQRHDYSDIKELEFNVSFDSLTKVGEIYLLNKSHLTQLATNLNEK